MTMKKIALLAAIAMLAVPASASAAGTLDQNLRLESDGFDVASPNIDNRNDFVDVIGDARYEERTDNPLAPVVAGVADRQRLRWSAHDLRFLKPTTVGTAPAAPDGTQFQTVIRQGTFNAITGALTYTSGPNIVRDAANNPILSTVEGQ